MAATVQSDAVFSVITVALLEDTGWYKVSFNFLKNLEIFVNFSIFFKKNRLIIRKLIRCHGATKKDVNLLLASVTNGT